MQLQAKEVREGGDYIGKEIYVCDFRWEDFDKKPTRKIKPTKVLIRDNSETTKRVNYSNVFLSEVKNDKLVKSSIIKIYDNTGYRTFPGIPLKMFTTESECQEVYENLKAVVLNNFEGYKSNKLLIISEIEFELNN